MVRMLRTAHLRRRRWSVADVAIIVVVVGGLVGCSSAANHAATAQASSVSGGSPITSGPASTAPAGQAYPARGATYVVVPDGNQLVWTDLDTGAHGHFGPPSGQISAPSVSADGRRVVFLMKTSGGEEIDFWNLDTHTGGAVRQPHAFRGSPAISPDGTRVVWAEQSGIHLVAIGDGSRDVSALSAVVGPPAQGVTWNGNDAIVYFPGSSGTCAVERLDMSAGEATQCLLPTATLDSVVASDGSTWHPFTITGTSRPGVFAFEVTAGARPTHAAIALLDTSAEASPFRVLQPTIVEDFDVADVANPVLLDGGKRVLYESYPGGQKQSPYRILVVSVDLTTGAKTTVTTVTVNTMDGLGATSG